MAHIVSFSIPSYHQTNPCSSCLVLSSPADCREKCACVTLHAVSLVSYHGGGGGFSAPGGRTAPSCAFFLKWQQQRAADADPILEMLKSRKKVNHPRPLAGQLKPLEDALLRHIFEQREQGITVHTIASPPSLTPSRSSLGKAP